MIFTPRVNFNGGFHSKFWPHNRATRPEQNVGVHCRAVCFFAQKGAFIAHVFGPCMVLSGPISKNHPPSRFVDWPFWRSTFWNVFLIFFAKVTNKYNPCRVGVAFKQLANTRKARRGSPPPLTGLDSPLALTGESSWMGLRNRTGGLSARGANSTTPSPHFQNGNSSHLTPKEPSCRGRGVAKGVPRFINPDPSDH